MSEVEVKALEWQELRPTDDNGFAQDAYSPIGHYIATEDGWFLVGQTQWTDTYNLEHAKAGAQADFDARIRSAIERKAEPVAWLFEGVGWGREVMLSHQEALDRKERLSRTWDIKITPLYASPPSPLSAGDAGEIERLISALEEVPLANLVRTNCTDVKSMWDAATHAQRNADVSWLRAALEAAKGNMA